MAITIRRATSSDASVLAELAARTFTDAFGAQNRPEDMALHLARSYGVPQQTEELNSPNIVTLLAETGGQAIGFAQLKAGAAPPCVTATKPIEVWRFYVTRAWHGRGVASILMDAVIDQALLRKAGALWLSSWERNPRGRAFYAKCGFIDVGTQIFRVGNDPQIDRILVRVIGDEKPGESRGESRHSHRV